MSEMITQAGLFGTAIAMPREMSSSATVPVEPWDRVKCYRPRVHVSISPCRDFAQATDKASDAPLATSDAAIVVRLADLAGCVEVDREVRGGIPVIRDTRIPVALILAETRDSEFLKRLARRLEVDTELLRSLFDQVALAFDKNI